IVPSPWPCAPAVIATHGDCEVADHAHSRSTDTLTCPVPPDAPKLDDDAWLSATWHRAALGPVTLVVAELPHAIEPASATVDRNSRGRRLILTCLRYSSHAPAKIRVWFARFRAPGAQRSQPPSSHWASEWPMWA